MRRVLTMIGLALVLAVVITYVATSDLLVTADKDTASADRQSRAERHRVKLSELRAATTAARFPGAPSDASPQAATDGLVVRPLRMLKVHSPQSSVCDHFSATAGCNTNLSSNLTRPSKMALVTS